MFYCFALVAPFLEISAYGRFQLANIETGPSQLAQQSFEAVGFLVLAVTVIFPGIKLGILLVTLTGVEFRVMPAAVLKALFRWYAPIRPWAMIDVYLLGFLVAYTKLIGMVAVHLDTALYALIGLMVSMAAADASLDSEAVWSALDKADNRQPDYSVEDRPVEPATAPAVGSAYAVLQELIGCHCCSLINQAEPGSRCRRCNTVLKARKTDSFARSWALLAAAAVFYIPANLYPVMLITQVGVGQTYTIFGGIIELADYGMWPLALLVFFASISIPIAKLITLAYMLVQTQTLSTRHLLGRTRAFRAIEFIGRWSMIDVFMISILVALVRFGRFADIRAQVGATCFAAVVVLTMFAVDCFDPRLMWDVPFASAGQSASEENDLLENAPG